MKASPVSPKVSNGTLAGLASTLLTSALVYFVPSWHSGLPGFAPYLISGAVGAIGYFGTGYLSKHPATAAEIATAIADMEKIASAVGTSHISTPVTFATGGVINDPNFTGGK